MNAIRSLTAAGWCTALLTCAFATDYYVSPQGDDAHDGRGAAPAQAFRTIQHGVDGLRAGDRLFVRAGTYRETVTFAHDGEPGAPIIVTAYSGEQPVISGLEPLTDWKSIGNDRWTTSMPWTLGLGRDQLFVGDTPLVEARYPNSATPGYELVDEAGRELPQPWPRWAPFSIPDYAKPFEVKLPPGQTAPAGWWDGAIYVGQHWDGWQAQCGIVEASEGDTLRVRTELGRGWWYPSDRPLGTGVTDRGRGMLVGHIHALDVAGEWVRATDGTVTLQVAAGTAPTGILAKRRHLGLDLMSRRHIEVRDLRLLGTSARLREASACTIAGCTLEWLSHFTHFAGTTGDIVKGIGYQPAYDGEAGLYLGGTGNTLRDCILRYSAGSGVIVDGFGQTIHNCLIEHCGYAGSYMGAIWIFGDQYRLSGGHRITRNTLRYSPRMLIGFFGIHQNSPSDQPLPYAASLIEGNHIHTGMFMAHDGGMLYWTDMNGGAWNGQRTLIRHNVIHDCRDWIGAGIIYFDADCWNFDVRENLMWAAPGTIPRPIFFSPPSVNCVRQDNVFFGATIKDPAKLVADEFPQKTAFAFGHDHQHSPPIPAWAPARIWSVSSIRRSAQSGGLHHDGKALAGWRDGEWAEFEIPNLSGWSTIVINAQCGENQFANTSRQWPTEPRHVRTADPLVLAAHTADQRSESVQLFAQLGVNFCDGSWLCFRNVALAAGFRQLSLVYAAHVASAKRVELHLDTLNGPLAASIELSGMVGTIEPPSGHPIPCEIVTAPFSADARGTRDVFVVVRGEGTDELMDIHQALLEQYRGTLPMGSDEVRLEVHAGNKDGPLLAAVFPGLNAPAQWTGVSLDWPATLDRDNAPGGAHRICILLRSAMAEPQLRVFSLRMERAANR